MLIFFNKPKSIIEFNNEQYLLYSEAKRLLGVEYTKLNIVIFVSIIALRLTQNISSDEMSFLTILLFTTLSDFLYPINEVFTSRVSLNLEEVENEKLNNKTSNSRTVINYMKLEQYNIIKFLINTLPISVASLATLKMIFTGLGFTLTNESFFTILALIHTVFGSWVATIFNRVYSNPDICKCESLK